MSPESNSAVFNRNNLPVQKTKILLVDDTPETLLALEAALHPLGEELVPARSGKEALRYLLEEDDFAAILLDVKMPEMDGFETAELIRSRPRSRHTPILFLTGYRNEEHLFRGYDLGAVDFLFKPIVPDVLRSKVAVFVELSRKAELLQRQSAALAQLNAHLEQRVVERTEELLRSNEELAQFAYVASHDLQEPLRTISLYTQLLDQQYANVLDGEAALFMRYITESAQRMECLIHDLLDFSRVDARARDHFAEISSQDALGDAMGNLRVHIEQSGALITSDPLPVILGDSIQVTRLFQNLILNSIKYRRPEEAPQIHVTTTLTGSAWTFSVTDNGIGIEPQYFEKIFGVFKRLHGRENPGTGIGLAICKKIVAKHGGHIWVESQPGKGSTFFFNFPYEYSAQCE